MDPEKLERMEKTIRKGKARFVFLRWVIAPGVAGALALGITRLLWGANITKIFMTAFAFFLWMVCCRIFWRLLGVERICQYIRIGQKGRFGGRRPFPIRSITAFDVVGVNHESEKTGALTKETG